MSMDRRCPVALVPRDLFRSSLVPMAARGTTRKRLFPALIRRQPRYHETRFLRVDVSECEAHKHHTVTLDDGTGDINRNLVQSFERILNQNFSEVTDFPLILGFVKKMHQYLDEVYDSQ